MYTFSGRVDDVAAAVETEVGENFKKVPLSSTVPFSSSAESSSPDILSEVPMVPLAMKKTKQTQN